MEQPKSFRSIIIISAFFGFYPLVAFIPEMRYDFNIKLLLLKKVGKFYVQLPE